MQGIPVKQTQPLADLHLSQMRQEVLPRAGQPAASQGEDLPGLQGGRPAMSTVLSEIKAQAGRLGGLATASCKRQIFRNYKVEGSGIRSS
jgi:hypothetical protein